MKANRPLFLIELIKLVLLRLTAKAFFFFERPTAGVLTRIETIYLKIRAHPLPRNEKPPLPVALRRSETPLLNLI